MPFTFSVESTGQIGQDQLLIEDRRSNPVAGRHTVFRILQQNALAYTFPDFIPGFAAPGINRMPFDQLVARPTDNARAEGEHRFGQDFTLSQGQVAKVIGDVFELVEAAILWNAAATWNAHMAGEPWGAAPRYRRPSSQAAVGRQVAVLSLPRGYDWVRLLVPSASAEIAQIRERLAEHDLTLPTSTPDILVVALPAEYRGDPRFATVLPDLGRVSQRRLTGLYAEMAARILPSEFLLAIALKKSLRSDRLYQPLYEANVMQLLLEGRLGAPQVDFEVHTLESAGTRAVTTYSAASLAGVATDHAEPHRSVRALYEPPTAEDLVRRFLAFLDARAGEVSPA